MPFVTRDISTAWKAASQNRCQGGTLSSRYGAAGIRDGDHFLVVIIHHDQIAQGPFQGIDIAKDQTCG
ncbi:MAG TPA: hypothetical protein VLJ59_16790 [Mycobacteriales bacterium]|nr:hypothetical protein [Mycobacteriales bacterium]